MRSLQLLALGSVCFAAGARGFAADDPKLPPGEDTAMARLNASPRHGELAAVDVAGTPVRVWVVHPERRDKAPVVVVIHEIFGLTDWVRGVADQLAADGFIALAPDLLSGKGPDGGGTDTFPNRDAATKAVSGLARDEALTRLNAVRDYGLRLPSANGKSASIGFCWGGATSFAWATVQPALDAAVAYYGTAPDDPAALGKIRAPVLGLYAGDDARVSATLDKTRETMKALGKPYEVLVLEGAGHGFLRAQAGQDGANLRATEQAWPKTIAFLRKQTGG